MLTADQLIDLNAGAIAAAPEGRTQFALRFAPPDSAADIAQFEALSGVPVPAPLRALYQGCGAFSHPGFGTPNTNPAVQTIHMRSVRDCILQRRREIGAGWLSCGEGLYGHTLDVWGGRPDLEEWLTEETQQRLDANYIVFAMRYVHDGEHVYWYYDGNGLFGALRFTQEYADENIANFDALAEIVPPDDLQLDPVARRAHVLAEIDTYVSDPDTFPVHTLDALIAREFASLQAGLTSWYGD